MALIGRRIGWSLLCAILCLGVARAHDSPEHQIEALSERLIREGDSADVLLERAIEYRVLGKLKEAARDLQRAVRLAPGDSLVLLELAQIELQRDGCLRPCCGFGGRFRCRDWPLESGRQF